MQQGYYTNRIKELEKRKEEVTGQLITSKLTLKGINKEIDNCYEYMNSAHYQENSSEIDSKLVEMEHKILSLENTVKKMNKTINQKNGKIKSLNKVIGDKDHEISKLKLEHHLEQSKLQEEISNLHIENNKKQTLVNEDVAMENRNLKKENRGFKRDIKALNERINLMDKTILKKNNELRILHERLGWQQKSDENIIYEDDGKTIGVKSEKNIFEELLEEQV